MNAGAGAGGVGVLDRGERAQRGADRGAGRRNQMQVGEVDVGEGDDACVREIAVWGDKLGARAVEIWSGDVGRAVVAGDGDVDLPGNQTAVLVVERDGEALD